MAPKKTQRSALWYYAKECMANGSCNANTIKEGIESVYTGWQSLSTTEKMPYQTKYDEWKKEIKSVIPMHSNMVKDELLGNVSALENDSAKNARVLSFEKYFKKEIFSLKNTQSVEMPASEYEKMKSQKFHFIKFSTLAKCDKFEEVVNNIKYNYSPYFVLAEVSIVEYSLKDGIINEYHAFIQPNKIPLGYRSMCMETARDKLGDIPLVGFKHVNKSYSEIYLDIQNFLNLSDEVNNGILHRSVFCMEKDLAETRFGLDFLLDRAVEMKNEVEPLMVENVYEIELLMNEIGKTKIDNYNAAKVALTSISFDYCLYTRCAYHEELNVMECSLNEVKKQCYIISDNLCQLFKIDLTNNHLPVQESIGTVVVTQNFGSRYKYRNDFNSSLSSSRRDYTEPNSKTNSTNSLKFEENNRDNNNNYDDDDDCEYTGSDASYPVKRHPVEKQTVVYPSQDIRLKENFERCSTVSGSMSSLAAKHPRHEDNVRNLKQNASISKSIPNGLDEDLNMDGGWTIKNEVSRYNLDQEVKSNVSENSNNSTNTNDNTSVVSGTSSKTSSKLYLGRGKPIRKN